VLGKQALYSGTTEVPTGRGSIVVTCPACGSETRIGLLDFLIFQLPIGVWLPWGRWNHRMTCPACRRRVWAGVTVRRR